MKVLVLNAGSSSIKYQVYQMPELNVIAKGSIDHIGEESHGAKSRVEDHEHAVEIILDALVGGKSGVIADISEIGAVGHRVVHGGEEFTGSVLIDDDVISSIEKFADLAPLHNPPNLTGIRAAQSKLPNAAQVACFDTAFHTSIPETAYMYGLPYEMYEQYRVRRYGFHGTSHRYVARRTAQLMGIGKYDLNAVTCHLGNGCSMTAIRKGKSIDTTMGLTPLEGLVMGTRSGDFDPAILFYLSEKGYDIESLNTLCNKKSGLLGISGISNDMHVLQEEAEKGNARAALAIDIFCYRVKKYIGAYAAVLGGLDALIFTGGIGENSVIVRRKICDGLDVIGVTVDMKKNENTVGTEGDISAASSGVRVWVVPTNEEMAIAKDTYTLAVGTESGK